LSTGGTCRFDLLQVKMMLKATLLALAIILTPVKLSAGVEAVTKPSSDVTLAFVRAGIIGEITVKEGESVEKGQMLVRLDDVPERLQLEQLKAEADQRVRVRAAEAQLEQRREDVIKLKEAEVKQWDIAHAELDAKIAELSLELAIFENEQSGRKADEAAAYLERMRLLSPINGKVEELFLETGEAADSLQKVVRVVQIDPLRIDVPCPRPTAEQLMLGRTAQVRFSNGEASPARITHIAAVADSASNTLTVRVEVPNPAGRPAGEHVMVDFELETAKLDE